MSSEALPQGHAPEAVGEVLGRAFGKGSSERIDRSLRAMSAWIMSNGDLERRHTVRVWLRDAPRRELDPIMVVEVDSHSLISDFNARRDVYLGRLAFYGQRVSRLEFRFAMRTDGVREAAGGGAIGALTAPQRLTPSAAELARAASLAEAVPPSMRGAVTTAVAASLSRTRQRRDAAGDQ